jgi:anti-sigma regulatory factor (Ser/Thr protein kinase)
MTVLSFKLKNHLSELDKLCRKLEQFGQQIGLSKKFVFQINLALDELFTNIVSYAFPNHDTHWIEFALSREDGFIVIRVKDGGIPFDPASINLPDLEKTIEDCKVGGLGLHIVRKMIDDITYERSGGKNITTLKKNIEEIQWKSSK